MDTSQWAQGNIGVVKVPPMVEFGSNNNPIIPKPLHHHHQVASNPNNSNNPGMVERKAIRPQKDQVLNCPRCNSSNTKFCYYNNYSLSQPRYFCKTCRRYWTEGGSLRNVPVGGGSRKNKINRPSSSSSSPSPTSNSNNSSSSNPTINLSSSILKKQLPQPSLQNPQDLNLAYPPPSTRGFNLMSSLMPNMSLSSSDHHGGSTLMYSSTTNNNNSGGGGGGGGFIPLQEFKPLHHEGLNFSFEGFENTTNNNNNGYVGGFQGIQLGAASGAARILFPIQDLKHNLPSPTTTTTTTPTITHEFQQHNDHNNNNNNNHRGGGISHGDNNNSSGFWSGMLGGAGSSW